MDFARVWNEALPLLLQGVLTTILISILSIIFGMVLGFVSCMMGLSKNFVLKWLSRIYVWLIRGTPMLVQAFIVYLSLPQVVQLFVPSFRIDSFTAGLVTLSLNAGAYLSEIFRGGIKAVDKGQIEAARSLGLSSARTMMKITLPQALRVAIPAMVNQFIITIKDTSIISVIGLAELVNRARTYVGSTYQFFATWVLVAAFYLVVISALMWVSQRFERSMTYDAEDGSGPGPGAKAAVLAGEYIRGE
ncbi:MAG: amino acid ABC transporter permease [Propionibacteriaceae bacterium]|jgi:His/Glu/Gln/Arg/opine family amino acid ABC transporter permease subunit|nr:amino acid ABC transporter permease [Propionibacteriaceae bacterium]